jgi:hypothetical protein
VGWASRRAKMRPNLAALLMSSRLATEDVPPHYSSLKPDQARARCGHRWAVNVAVRGWPLTAA